MNNFIFSFVDGGWIKQSIKIDSYGKVLLKKVKMTQFEKENGYSEALLSLQ